MTKNAGPPEALYFTPLEMYIKEHLDDPKLDEFVALAVTGRRKKIKPPTSKYKGVCWSMRSSKWLVRIAKDNKHIELGLFVNEDDAARAYNEKAIELHGNSATLNEVQ